MPADKDPITSENWSSAINMALDALPPTIALFAGVQARGPSAIIDVHTGAGTRQILLHFTTKLLRMKGSSKRVNRPVVEILTGTMQGVVYVDGTNGLGALKEDIAELILDAHVAGGTPGVTKRDDTFYDVINEKILPWQDDADDEADEAADLYK